MTDPNPWPPAAPAESQRQTDLDKYAPAPPPAHYPAPTPGGQPMPMQGYPQANQPQYAPQPFARQLGTKRSAWGVWWLSYLTLGIYYLVWYYKINRELATFASHAVKVRPGLAVVAQFVPIVNWVSLAHTATRLNAAAASIGSPVHVSGGMTILSSWWFGSQTRYLQRRLNGLWDAASTLHAHGR